MTEQPAQGKLIVFEGPDGVGKSTLAEQLTVRLREAGVPCEHLAFPGRQPGSLGSLVYDLHHDAHGLGLGEVNPTSLQLLHIAAHVDAIEGHILPALRTGAWIVLDRFWWSTWVYGAASGVSERSLETMIELERLHWGQVKPDVLFLVERESGTPGDGDVLQGQILEGYRELANREQLHSRVVTLHNCSSVEDALDAAWEAVTPIARRATKGRVSSTDAQQDVQLPLLEAGVLNLPIVSRLSPAKPTIVYDTYWHFAVERQEVFFRKLEGIPAPWTTDPILARYKFTNAYRASDRVSQYLIRHVIYEGDQTPEEVFFRTILFKLFNRIETWEMLRDRFTTISQADYSFQKYDDVLTEALAAGTRIYSAAYMMPSGRSSFGHTQKHRNHLLLLERLMEDEVPHRLTETSTMAQAFDVLLSYPTIGNFLAYQFVTDLNYSNLTSFSEMDFVVPGPGALDGIRKCFTHQGGLNDADIIRVVTDNQEREFERLGLEFRTLGGRRLQLIDCQNLFCEVSKYARVRHPEIEGLSKRTRIKQFYRPSPQSIPYWYPPKWGINHLIPCQGGQDDLVFSWTVGRYGVAKGG